MITCFEYWNSRWTDNQTSQAGRSPLFYTQCYIALEACSLLSWWISAHSQDSKPVLLGYRWQLKMHCTPITAVAQTPPLRKALSLCHHVPVCTWSYFCFHQKDSMVEWKKQKILWHLTQQNIFAMMDVWNTCQPACWSLCKWESQVSAYGIDSQPPSKPC